MSKLTKILESAASEKNRAVSCANYLSILHKNLYFQASDKRILSDAENIVLEFIQRAWGK